MCLHAMTHTIQYYPSFPKVILVLKVGYLRITHPFAMESKLPIRLACIRHAASVNPEPGSNSPKKYFGAFSAHYCLKELFFNS